MANIFVLNLWLGILLFLVAFFIVWITFPIVLKIANKWNIYDNPNRRKLHNKPIPVLGGLAVFFGVATGFLILCLIFFSGEIILMLFAMVVLLVVGIIDDKYYLPVTLRFIIEIGVVLGMMLINGNMIDHFHGLFGLKEISPILSYPLSIIAGVGIINAINLIDGVDGYSSGFVALSCILFAVIFFESKIPGLAIICLICTGAVLPFFVHNVFGKSTKMFIGDGGALMLGTLITALVFSILQHQSLCTTLEYHNVGLLSVCFAILSLPVTDTLRVMITRMIKGHLPFHPDKTHLHHLFIDMGFSHFGTTLCLLFMNTLVVIGWLVAWKCGADVTMQFFVVISLSVLNTLCLFSVMKNQMKTNGKIYKIMYAIGRRTHWNNSRLWIFMQKIVDNS